jgi:hypothetical protein
MINVSTVLVMLSLLRRFPGSLSHLPAWAVAVLGCLAVVQSTIGPFGSERVRPELPLSFLAKVFNYPRARGSRLLQRDPVRQQSKSIGKSIWGSSFPLGSFGDHRLSITGRCEIPARIPGARPVRYARAMST